jgi:Holliday junction resolvase RusA-like endonuclease
MPELERTIEMHAPKIQPHQVRVNLLIRGEPQPWQRAGRVGARTFDDPKNVRAKAKLKEHFEMAYPEFQAIDNRRLGVQMFFQTADNNSDLDNLEKLVGDAFQGIIWANDRQIKENYGRVNVWPTKPFMQLVVYLLDPAA